MTRPRLRKANRAVLDAITTPPDTGVEADLDRIASHLHFLAEEKPMAPDHGRLSLLRYKLRELEERAHRNRVGPIRRARELLAEFQRSRGSGTRASTEG